MNEIAGYFGSALQAAASMGHLESVRVLLDAGAVAEEKDVGYYHSALLAASGKYDDTNSDLVRLLVERGANVNTKQKGPYPYPLLTAAKHLTWSDNHIVKLLLELGADVNARGGKYGTALQAAAVTGDDDLTQILLDNGADPNLTGGWYHTPLQAAYRCGYYVVIAVLYKNGAVNTLKRRKRAGSVMGEAIGGIKCDDGIYCGACQTLINQLLFRHKFDPNTEYGLYGNALQNVIIQQREEDVFKFVLNAGANVNQVGGKMGTALASAAFVGDMNQVEELLRRGADVNLGNHRYPNAAFGAIRGHHRETLKRLLDAGADVVTPSGQFGTALQGAAWSGRLDHVRMLLRHGAAINPPPGGLRGTPLQAAAAVNHTTVMRYLIRRGADLRAGGGRGSVLHTAVLMCTADTVEFLLKKEQTPTREAPSTEHLCRQRAPAAR